jgi:LacI family transcriptional regulator
MAAELLDLFAPGCHAAVFASARSVRICRENLDGFTFQADALGLTVDEVYENQDEPDRAYRAADDLIRRHPDVRGIYVCSANSEPLCRRLTELGRAGRYRLVTTDLFDDVVRYLKEGVIQATLFQNPRRQAELAVGSLYGLLTGDEPSEEQLVLPQVVLSSNCDDVLRQNL